MKARLQRLWKNEFVQGGFFLTASSFFINILNYFFHFFAARILGPENYGSLNAFYSYMVIFSVPMTVLSTIVIQRIGSQEENRREYAQGLNHFFQKVLWQIFPLFLLAFFLAPYISQVTNLPVNISFFLLPMLLSSLIGSFYSSVLQGLRLFLVVSFFGFLGSLVKLGSVLLPIATADKLNLVILLQFAGNLAILLGIIFLLNSLLKKHTGTRAYGKPLPFFARLFKSEQFIITMLSVVGITLLSNIDIVFVKKYFTPLETGLYSSWSLFAKILFYLVGPIIQVVFVFFAENRKQKLQEQVLLISLWILLFVGVVGYIGYAFFGRFFILILFGNKYLSLLPYLGLAALFGSLYSALNFLNSYFLAKKSRFALILFFSLPLYWLLLNIFKSSLLNLMTANILFAIVVLAVYLGAFFFEKARKS